jgi:hypothetical protein
VPPLVSVGRVPGCANTCGATLDELKAKLEALKVTREIAEKEPASLAGRRERLEAMERGKDLILESYATLAPEALDALSPEERRKEYVMLNLTVEALVDGGLKISGAFGEETALWEDVGTSRRPFLNTNSRYSDTAPIHDDFQGRWVGDSLQVRLQRKTLKAGLRFPEKAA